MPRTEHPVHEDPDTLTPCSRGAGCAWVEEGELGHPLPRTLAYFPKDSWVRDGMSVRCKKCASRDTVKSRRKKAARIENEIAEGVRRRSSVLDTVTVDDLRAAGSNAE